MSDHDVNDDVKDNKVPTPSEVAAKTAKSSEQVEPEKQEVFDAEYVAKLRRESAGYRTKLKELEPLLDEYKQQKEKGKSDLEKALERIQELESESAANKQQALRAKVAQATGVPADLLPNTADEDELTEAANTLKKWAENQQLCQPLCGREPLLQATVTMRRGPKVKTRRRCKSISLLYRAILGSALSLQ